MPLFDPASVHFLTGFVGGVLIAGVFAYILWPRI